MSDYELRCWKTDYLDPGSSSSRRIESAKVGDYTSDPDWDSDKYQIFIPGKKNKNPYDLSKFYVYWNPSYQSGSHTGSSNSATLVDSTKSWTTDELVGLFVYNTTDSSYGEITANTATTITANLKDGSENDWDSGDSYQVGKYYMGQVKPKTTLSLSAIENPTYYRPFDLLIYYGFLNSFNYTDHSWDNEKVSQEIAKYDVVVLGSGLAEQYDSGSHNGSNNVSVLSDSTKSWTTNEWAGGNYRVRNLTDGSSGIITANTASTITATLAGGTDNDWDTDDQYEIRHADYENTIVILPRIAELKPDIRLLGYIDGTLSQSDFETEVDAWVSIGVTGIFIDQAGYDFGTTTTNSRSAMNAKVDYIHTREGAPYVMVNAWNMDHIIGIENDASYPNSTWNPDLLESTLSNQDWYLLESTPINTTAYTGTEGYQAKATWKARCEKAIIHRYAYGIHLAACGIINDDNANGQDLFNFGLIASLMYTFEAWGTSDTAYGAGTSKTKWWTRPDVTGLGILSSLAISVTEDASDSDVYLRYVQFGKLMVDFSSGAQDSDIEKW